DRVDAERRVETPTVDGAAHDQRARRVGPGARHGFRVPKETGAADAEHLDRRRRTLHRVVAQLAVDAEAPADHVLGGEDCAGRTMTPGRDGDDTAQQALVVDTVNSVGSQGTLVRVIPDLAVLVRTPTDHRLVGEERACETVA